MTEVLKAGVLSDEIDLGALAHNAAEQAEEFVRKVSWKLKQKLFFHGPFCYFFQMYILTIMY